MTAMTLLTAGCMLVVLAPAVLGDGYGHGHGGYGHSSHGEGTACIVKVLRIIELFLLYNREYQF